MIGALNKTPDYEVSSDFNGRLLSRIGIERFRETRTRAYFPKRTPIFGWSRAVPAVATACLILAFVLTGGVKQIHQQGAIDQIASTANADLDNSYLTVQPQSNDALTQHTLVSAASKNWAFKTQLARYRRIRGLMDAMQIRNDFASYSSSVVETPQVCCGPRIMFDFPSGASAVPVTGNSQVRMVSGGNGSN